MSLRTRIALAMIVLVAVTAGSVAWLANRAIRSQGLPEALDALAGDARLLAGALQAAALGSGTDALVLAGLPSATTLATAGTENDDAKEALAVSFLAELRVKRRYLQLRFIDAEGREVVGVDRNGPAESPRVVPDSELQDRSQRPYVRETLAMPPGALHVSPVELDEELGVGQLPPVVVMRFSTPVESASTGAVGGFVIVNVDMRPLLNTLRAEVGDARRLYVLGGNGFVVHPDTTRQLGGSEWRPGNWTEDFPELPAEALEVGTYAELTRTAGETVGLAARTVRLAGAPRVTVILTEAPDRLLAGQARVVRSAILGGALVALMATLLSATMARSLSRPVTELSRAIERFEATGSWKPPTRRGDLAALSDTFTRVLRSERRKTAALEREVESRRAAEQALEREATQLRLLSAVVQSSHDGIFTLTLDGVVTSWNPGAERLYGYSAEEIIGRHKSTLVPEHLRPELDEMLERLSRGDPVRHLETTRITKEGIERDVSLTLSPVYAATGEVVGISEVARDIGERKALEERFRLSVEACPNGMVMVDHSGGIVLVNREVERLFGYSRDEILGESIEVLVPEAARGSHPEQRRHFVDHPQRRAMGSGRDLFGRRKDGTEIPVEIGLNPLHTPDGLFVLASIVDISERVKAEEELRRSNAELEQFAYVASHDLQEPLRMVASYTELLAQRYGGQLDQRADKYIGYAANGAKRMQLLINDLLRFSRIDSEAKPLAATDLGTVVREVLDRRLAGAVRDAAATVEIGELPVVLSDDVQIAQVFQNLISNALKFSADGRAPVVRIASERRGSKWVLSVEDNGIGIEPGHEALVFEMFQRLNRGDSYPGSGIGLTLCRKIVQRHGGRIWFESVPGSGTTFYFTLEANRT